jgi:hypothetical protein
MIRLVFVCFVLALSGPLHLYAQTDQTGVLKGSVVDQNGTPVASAEVAVSLEDGSYPGRALTDDNGAYRIGFMKPGLYTVTVRTIGYRPVVHTGVRITATQTTTLDVVSESSPVQLEAITVLAEQTLIERTTQQVNTTVNRVDLELLPIPRTAVELVEFTPGARSDQVWGGSTEQANVYQLDGVNVNDPGFGGDFLLPNVDWIEEINVKGLGAGAEYGGFQGGVVNIVTKSGTNTFEPNLRFNYGASSLNASNVNAYEAGSEQDSRWELNGDIAGPIVRDKLYYFVSGQYVRTNTRVVDFTTSTEDDVQYITDGSGSTLFEERNEAKFLGKLTYQATAKDGLDVSAGYDGFFTDNFDINSFDSPETALKQESPAVFGNVSWQRQWSGKHHTELKVTGYNAANDLLPLNGPNTTNVRLLGGNRESFRNNEYTRIRSPDNIAIALNWDSYWYTGNIMHELKVGGEYRLGWWSENRTRNANLAWRPDTSGSGTTFDPDDPSTWATPSGGFISSDWGGDINLDARSTNASIYVQDYIDITPRISISPGLRLSYFRGDMTPGDGGPRFKATDDVQIAPRLGASVSLLADRNLTLKGHWGRYYQDMFALMFDRVEGGEVFTNLEYWDWIDASDPELDRAYTEAEREQLFVFFGEETLGDEVGPVENWKQPHVDQFVAGLELEFARNWKASAFYVNRRNKSIVSLVDKNQETNYTAMSNIQVIDFQSGEPVLDQNGQPLVLDMILVSNDDILFVDEDAGLSQGELDALGLAQGDVAGLTYEQDFALTVAEDATRKMDQVQVSVERVFRRWSLLASVVWTDLRGNFFSVSGYDNPFGIGTGPFVRPNERTNYDGRLQNHSEWEFKLRANANLPANIRVGGFATFFSGDFYAPIYRIDRRLHDFVTDDGTFLNPELFFGVDGENIFLEQRGNRRLDEFFRFDLHVGYTVPLRRIQPVIALDVFNLFNGGAVTTLKTEVNDQNAADPTTLFTAPRLRQNPRNIRLYVALKLF